MLIPFRIIFSKISLYFSLQNKNVLPAAGVQEPVRLKFNIGHDVQSAIETAKENIDS